MAERKHAPAIHPEQTLKFDAAYIEKLDLLRRVPPAVRTRLLSQLDYNLDDLNHEQVKVLVDYGIAEKVDMVGLLELAQNFKEASRAQQAPPAEAVGKAALSQLVEGPVSMASNYDPANTLAAIEIPDESETAFTSRSANDSSGVAPTEAEFDIEEYLVAHPTEAEPTTETLPGSGISYQEVVNLLRPSGYEVPEAPLMQGLEIKQDEAVIEANTLRRLDGVLARAPRAPFAGEVALNRHIDFQKIDKRTYNKTPLVTRLDWPFLPLESTEVPRFETKNISSLHLPPHAITSIKIADKVQHGLAEIWQDRPDNQQPTSVLNLLQGTYPDSHGGYFLLPAVVERLIRIMPEDQQRTFKVVELPELRLGQRPDGSLGVELVLDGSHSKMENVNRLMAYLLSNWERPFRVAATKLVAF